MVPKVNIPNVSQHSKFIQRERVTTNGGVDVWLGSSTQRALTWTPLSVPSGDGGTHRCSLVFLLDRQQTTSCFRPIFVVSNFATVAVLSVRQITIYLCLRLCVMIVIMVTYSRPLFDFVQSS